ncbi:TetR/AcrR family transcriptional regulator [Cellulomonas cellasea]|uniref:AcrR family transcriptional regulator n=1 Tax=Cellulomonas cellasea TaxID=43670 RepID=A0A7W4YBB4_9CELL|nr:TetR/AcrR family transcriptional regulator [Cellulomonas cellasea]MBB2923725.1 AcrR family transcriptional regulator [Cellulomonas cellasea]
MNRAEQRRRTREALLEAAAEEFVARGYGQATLQGAADRLGLTRGTVLFHYKSKDALRDALCDWADARLTEAVEAEQAGDPDARFVATLRGFAQVYAGDVRVRAGLALQEERSREHPVVSAWRAALDARAAAYLADRHGDGPTGERVPPVAAVALTSMFLGVVRDPAWRTDRQLRAALDHATTLLTAR